MACIVCDWVGSICVGGLCIEEVGNEVLTSIECWNSSFEAGNESMLPNDFPEESASALEEWSDDCVARVASLAATRAEFMSAEKFAVVGGGEAECGVLLLEISGSRPRIAVR